MKVKFAKFAVIMNMILTFNASHSKAADLSLADQYRQILVNPYTLQSSPESVLGHNDESQSRVKTSLVSTNMGIMNLLNGAAFTAHQFLGYSGAGFLQMNEFIQRFRNEVLRLQSKTLESLGQDAKTVLILGATVDGFGKGYEVIDSMRKEGLLKNVIVVGMASNEAVTYHLQGLKEGWGDVISPKQDLFYLKETFVDEQGNRSWELKTSPGSESDTAKILKDLSRLSTAGVMTFNVFGGGAQAFNETMELILEARNRPAPVEINLNIGFEPGKPKKDSGYRAADMLAFVIAEHPELLSKNVQLNIIQKNKRMKLRAYKNSQAYKTLSQDSKNAKSSIEALKFKDQSPEVQAQIKYFQILVDLEKLPLKEIELFRLRSSHELSQSRQDMMDHLRNQNVSAYEAFMSRVDNCTRCAGDSQMVEANYKQSLRIRTCSMLLGSK